MNRKELDAFVAHYALAPADVAVALELAGARPSTSDLVRFAVRLLKLAGVLSLAAGIVFFVAANWEALAVLGRFVLVEAVLVLSVAVALWKPPPEALGRYALLRAFIATGALLALFGQTYQTGADVYELFLTWALLGVFLAVAGQWSVTWAAWLLVLNVALWLYCAWQPQSGWLWLVFGPWASSGSALLLVPMIVNFLLWFATVYLERGRFAALTPAWLGRFVLTCAVGFATWAGGFAIVGSQPEVGHNWGDVPTLIIVLGLLAAIAVFTLRQRRDVFPLALVSWLVIWAPLIAGCQALIAYEARWMAGRARLLARTALTGLLMALAIATWASEPLGSLVFWSPAGETYANWLVLWPLLGAGTALFAAICAYRLQNRALVGLAIAGALLHVVQFYYLLGTTLIIKSMIMLAVGAAFFFGAWGLGRNRAQPARTGLR